MQVTPVTARLVQWAQRLALRLPPNRLGLSEFSHLGLSDPTMQFSDRRKFVGWRTESRLDKQLNDTEWRAVANDKLLFHLVARGAQLPTPQVKAIYCRDNRLVPGTACLASPSELRDFILQASTYPMFAKPIWGSFGRGAMAFRSLAGEGSLRTLSGTTIPVDEAIATIDSHAPHGYLFQELLSPCPTLQKVCGPRLTGVRLIVLMSRGRPKVFRAVWKVPTGTNYSDNFMQGRTGNLIGSISVSDGKLIRVIQGSTQGPREIERHPDTQIAFSDVTIPNWKEVLRLAETAALFFPGLRLQNWDVALSDSGPILLEVNVEGSLDLPQIADGRGFWDESFEQFLRDQPDQSPA